MEGVNKAFFIPFLSISKAKRYLIYNYLIFILTVLIVWSSLLLSCACVLQNVTLPVRSAVGTVLSPVLPVWRLMFWPHRVSAALAVRPDITLMKTGCAKVSLSLLIVFYSASIHPSVIKKWAYVFDNHI